mgnify:CR=1 FL=1
MSNNKAKDPAVDFDPNPIFGSGESRVSLHISSVIIDRLAGASLVDDVWSDKENVDFIVHRLQASPTMRNEIAQLFMSGAMAQVFEKIIDANTFRAGGLKATKTEVFFACQSVTGSTDTATVVAEFVCAMLIANSMVSSTAKFAVRRKIPYSTVTIEALGQDLLKQEIVKSIASAKQRFVITSGTHSTSAVAEEFSDIFRSIGIALTIMNDFDNVLHDIVLGVLANIDPAPLETQRGSVTSDLRDHAVVKQLETNWNFIQAALELRNEVSGANGASAGVRMACNAYQFDKHAPVVLTMLRNSDRYQMISRAQFVSTVGSYKILGLDGVPQSTVLYDNASMEATAMVVVSVKDATLEGALNLQELPDRVSERMMSAYGSLPSALNMPSVARCLADVLELAIEGGSTVKPLYMCRLTDQLATLDAATIAVMLAERVSARFDDDGKDYTLVYSGATEYGTLKLKSGSVLQGTFSTTDAAEFFLASPAFEPKQAVVAPAQLIPRNALRSRLLGYDESDFVTSADRGGYKVDALGVSITGVIRLKELTSIRMGDLATLVSPFHNSQVYAEIEAIVKSIVNIAKAIQLPAANKRAMRTLAQFALNAAQGLAAGFRDEIHEAIMEKAAEKLSYEDSIKMRAKLRQHAMAAYADILAATIFLKVQGIADKSSIFDDLAKEPEIVNHWVELGSDRVR